MSNLDSQKQESLKMSWQQERRLSTIEKESHKNSMASPNFYSRPSPLRANPKNNIQIFPGGFDDDDDLVSAVVPPVTVVLEGRSICQRISLHKHTSYQSLAKALSQMFVDGDAAGEQSELLDLSTAVPGHLIAYEDMENDLLLVGDLKWNELRKCERETNSLITAIMDSANSSTLMNMRAFSVVTFNGLNFAEWKEQVEYRLGVQDLDQAILEKKPPAPSEDNTIEKRATCKA
ncbi:hypothetical protein ACH5RR_003836 [Cinchona calisaya]|uniref:Auxin-responsive protein n=1 Tax=Cinchona calisaya TaxID=153742 RepID=A0ABD3AVU8_9GENT